MFRFFFNGELIAAVSATTLVLIGGAVWLAWTFYRDGTLRKWTPLWLQIAWARLCGWRVIRGDVHEQVCVPHRGKLWVTGDVYTGPHRPATVVAAATARVVVSGNIFPNSRMIGGTSLNARGLWPGAGEAVIVNESIITGQPRSA